MNYVTLPVLGKLCMTDLEQKVDNYIANSNMCGCGSGSSSRKSYKRSKVHTSSARHTTWINNGGEATYRDTVRENIVRAEEQAAKAKEDERVCEESRRAAMAAIASDPDKLVTHLLEITQSIEDLQNQMDNVRQEVARRATWRRAWARVRAAPGPRRRGAGGGNGGENHYSGWRYDDDGYRFTH